VLPPHAGVLTFGGFNFWGLAVTFAKQTREGCVATVLGDWRLGDWRLGDWRLGGPHIGYDI